MKIRTIVILVLLYLGMTTSFAVQYQVHDLGVLPGTGTTWATDINASGQIVGWAETKDTFRYPVIWDANGNISRIGNLSGYNAGAQGINNDGVVVGYAGTGFVWSAGGGISALGIRAVRDISNTGLIVGNTPSHACLWDSKLNSKDLGTLPGDASSIALAVNDSGTVVGYSYPAIFSEKAFIWTAETGMRMLNGLGGLWGEASDINNAGEVVGTSRNASGEDRACLWHTDGSVIDLGAISQPYYNDSIAYGINNEGTVVGSSAGPVAWEANTYNIQQLPILAGYTSGEALRVNDLGQIVGYCSYNSTTEHWSHAVVWTPVPEPSSLLSLAIALTGLVLLVRHTPSLERQKSCRNE